MELREFTRKDCTDTAQLFYETVHGVNKRDYPPNQLHAWAPAVPSLSEWGESLLSNDSWVAIEDGRIVGFADMDAEGRLRRLYVHRDYQRRGIATALCDCLESRFHGTRLSAHALITAKSFLERRGYRMLREQAFRRGSLLITGFIMEKNNAAPKERAPKF